MAMKCKICNHDNRKAIDSAVAKGGSIRSIAQIFNVSYYSLYRHSRNDHLSRQLQTAYAKKAEAEGLDVLAELTWTLSQAKDILKEARAKGSNHLALTALARVQSSIELLSKIEITLRREYKEEVIGLDLSEFDMDVLTEDEMALMDSIALKRLTQMSGASVGTQPGSNFKDFQEVRSNPKTNKITNPEESREEEPAQETKDRGQVKDNHLDDLVVRPVPHIIPYDPLKSQPKK